MHRYIWLVPLLPLLGAAINGLLGRRFRFSEKVVGAIAVGSVALAFLISVMAVYSYGFSSHAIWPNAYVTSDDGAFKYTWIPGGATEITQGAPERARAIKPASAGATEGEPTPPELAEGAAESDPPMLGQQAARDGLPNESSGRGSLLDIEWSYQLDSLSAVFMLIITGVGLCIFVFATGYMHGDPGFYRFFAYLGLFMFMMLILVMGSNFLMMFVGWEGVGLCSYLLIGYYFDRKEAGDAARKAFITNRIGDFGFALAVFAIIATFGSVQYGKVMAEASGYPIELLGQWGILSWIALGLFVGACGKSAQFPLYVWLPDAMAGPTPVSALIHAATMVTAGLYMLTRTNVIFQHSQTMMLVVAIVGAFTALFAAAIAFTQNDIKKVLAYSTVSQLGFMFMACGVGAFVIGIFHVMTHAFFKALMFLGAGSVIHGMHHEQDMRRMGGLKKYMPTTYKTFLAGWLAICGIIPFSGFWSKDEILWNAASTNYIPYGWAIWLVGTIAATGTAFYMTRLVAMTFWGKERFREVHAGGESDEAHAHGYDEHGEPHDPATASVADRPHHDPHEHVGVAHDVHASHAGAHLHDAHEHGSHVPHESPRSMVLPLVVLAILATVGGLIGIGPAFKFIAGSEHPGGRLNIVTWLSPVIWNPATHDFNRPHGAGAEEGHGEEKAVPGAEPAPNVQEAGEPGLATPYGDTGFNLAHAVDEKLHNHTLTEWIFILISLAVAGFGIFLGWLFYVKNPRLPEIWAARLGWLYRASLNKFWVDELYGAVFTRRTMDAANGVYDVDSEIIDGAVNGVARLTRDASRLTGNTDKYVVDGLVNTIAGFISRLMSPLIRAAQTGLTANYAFVMVLGLVVALAIVFGKDIVTAVKTAFAFIL